MAPLLQVERLHKSFSGVRALEGVDIEVHEGEILGLVGPNGSGKTTMFNCVTGFVRPTSGRVLLRGAEVTRLAPDQIARQGVIRTFQHKMVFPKVTVRENIEIAWRPQYAGGEQSPFGSCEGLLEFLGLRQMAPLFAGDIPFGSARKVGLGIALAACPRLLLLDEPAAGLDQDESRELALLIQRIRDLDVTVWIIEHDVSLMMSTCHRIIVLDAGRKIAEGKPGDVANDPAVISVFLGEKFARSTSA